MMDAIPSTGSCRTHFCDDCNRGYEHDDIKHHPCKGKWCRSCERKDCPDFIAAKQACGPGNYPVPNESCNICHREFHGTHCYNYHLQRRDNGKTCSICDIIKKCPDCRHVYKLPDKYKKYNAVIFPRRTCTSVDGLNVQIARKKST